VGHPYPLLLIKGEGPCEGLKGKYNFLFERLSLREKGALGRRRGTTLQTYFENAKEAGGVPARDDFQKKNPRIVDFGTVKSAVPPRPFTTHRGAAPACPSVRRKGAC